MQIALHTTMFADQLLDYGQCANSWILCNTARVTYHKPFIKCWFPQIWLYQFGFWTSHKTACLCLCGCFIPQTSCNIATTFRLVITPQLKVVGHAQWEHITVLMLLQCTTKVLKDHILCVWMIHDTCFHSAIWNATNQAFMLYVPVWLILLRQFVIHKQPSVYQDSCVTCHAKYCPPMFTRNSHLSACSLGHSAECTCLGRSLLLHKPQHALHSIFASTSELAFDLSSPTWRWRLAKI